MSALETEYRDRYATVLKPLAKNLEEHLDDLLKGCKRIDRIGARAKSVDRFLGKARKANKDGTPKYTEPLSQIQDQIGARIIAFYLQDVESIHNHISQYFKPIETLDIVPDSEREFGYFGKHYIFFLPVDVFTEEMPREKRPKFFELQIKTLFQHAWAEAEHDLSYKPPVPLTSDQIRKIAFTAAQSWGADKIFEELVQELLED